MGSCCLELAEACKELTEDQSVGEVMYWVGTRHVSSEHG